MKNTPTKSSEERKTCKHYIQGRKFDWCGSPDIRFVYCSIKCKFFEPKTNTKT